MSSTKFHLPVLFFGIALMAMPETVFSGVYRANLSKISDNHYESFNGLRVITQNCYANLFQSPVLIIVDEFSTEDSLIVDANTRCAIQKMQLEHWEGSQALQSLDKASSYRIDIDTNSGLQQFKIGSEAYETSHFCGTWNRGDLVVLLREQSWSSCSDTLGFNLTRNEACKLRCE